jgi:glycosyltransferase involved in cell wall biosynthesis
MTTNLIMNPHYPRITAILPAYNEERNIQAVLHVLQQTDTLDEIFLVDDGSLDNTFQLMQAAAQTDPRMHVLHHEKNLGKGQAVLAGWAASSGAVILLLDSDLKNLNPDHLRALLAPVLDRRADMTLGLFRGGHINTDFSHWATPFLTGQRAFRSKIMKYISQEASKGYGFEVALTIAARQNNFRTHIVALKGVWHPPSEFHRSGWNGITWRVRMYTQIVRAWWVATRERYPKAKQFFSSILKP